MRARMMILVWAMLALGCAESESAGGSGGPESLSVRRVGAWSGFEVFWANDRSASSRSKGMYLFKEAPGLEGDDFSVAKRIGLAGGKMIYYVSDRNRGSRAPGFYAVMRDGKLRPMAGFGAAYGKATAGYGAAEIDESGALKGPGSEFEGMSAEELDGLSGRAARAAAELRERGG